MKHVKKQQTLAYSKEKKCWETIPEKAKTLDLHDKDFNLVFLIKCLKSQSKFYNKR